MVLSVVFYAGERGGENIVSVGEQIAQIGLFGRSPGAEPERARRGHGERRDSRILQSHRRPVGIADPIEAIDRRAGAEAQGQGFFRRHLPGGADGFPAIASSRDSKMLST